MVNKKLILPFLLLTFLYLSGQGQTRKFSNEFMNIGVGGRALAMGKAQVAATDDVTSGYWNPAGLTRIEPDIQIGLQHSEYFAGIANYDYGSIAFKIDERSHLGVSLIRFGVDNIPNTLELVDQSGGVDYSRVSGFSAADYGGLISYARKLDDEGKWRLGGNAKIIHRNVGEFATAWGFGLDLGVQFETGRFQLGMMATDVSTTFNAWNFTFSEEEKRVFSRTNNVIPESSVEITLPQTIFGVNYTHPFGENFELATTLDLDVSYDGRRNTLISGDPASVNPRFGTEFGMWDIVFIRAGVSNFQEETLVKAEEPNEKVVTFQPSLGAGIQYKVAQLDYAFTDIGDQSIALYSHVISLRLDIFKGMFEE